MTKAQFAQLQQAKHQHSALMMAIDRSGSMGGNKINTVREAGILFGQKYYSLMKENTKLRTLLFDNELITIPETSQEEFKSRMNQDC
mmetsp:Transcript_16633/g.15937  ORF Transcript_16633/g.15937 Transcript_16633/m.15937 type:complete len:87 (+) Transcript_16633:114-374(+)